MNFKNFLLGKEADFKGRTIKEIWDFSDIQIEKNHDFIQLIFPLNKKSQNVCHGYYLDNEADAFYKSILALCLNSIINKTTLEFWKNA